MRQAVLGLGLLMVGAAAPLAPASAADLAHLRALAGHYTDEIMADPALDRALHQVLGDGYAAFADVMQVVFPSELIDNRVLVATGCRQHDCHAHRGLLMIDLETGAVTALRSDRDDAAGPVSPALQAAIGGWLQ